MYSPACQRFRRLAALSVDGELSELEALAFAQHLELCAPCGSFAATIETATREMREAKLEPCRVMWSPVPRRRGVDAVVRRAVTLASVASVAAFAGATLQALDSPPKTPRALPVMVIDASGADTARETTRFLRGLKDAALAREVGGPDRAEADRPGVKSG